MVGTSALALRQNGQVELVSTKLERTEAKSQSASPAKDEASKSESSIKDIINLSTGLDFGKKLQDAKTTDDLLSLLNQGQREAREAIEKFNSLLTGKGANIEDGKFAHRQAILIEATQKTVVEIMVERKSKQSEGDGKVPMSFEARLMTNIRTLDPEFFDDIIEDARKMFGFKSDVDSKEEKA